MSPDPSSLAQLALAWTLYFGAHSVLASLAVKRWVAAHVPAVVPAYRLLFNGTALLLLLPVLAYMHALAGPWLWRWRGPWAGVAYGLAGLVALGFGWSLRYYDGSEFLGLRQWRARQRSVLDQERLHLSPLHRFVRHPWYTLGLVLVWTQDMDAARLTSAVVISVYFVIGSRLEERKLLLYHGPAYAAYRRRVPALIPLPWRSLSGAEARELTRMSRLRGSSADEAAGDTP